MSSPRRYPHWLAVVTIAFVACIFGAGFAAMQTVLRGGLSVGAAITLRFIAATIVLAAILFAKGTRFDRQSVRDGAIIGLLLVSIFWLQTDGLRFTTTSKSGFITSLYVAFTPMLALFFGERVRVPHAIGAALATIGLFALVHEPGGLLNGWNRGDFETLICSFLCAGHVWSTAHFSRRSDAGVLAFMQMAVTAGVSLVITVLLPAPHGFHGVVAAITRPDVLIALAYMVTFNSVFAFWALSTMQAYLTSTEAAVVYSLEPVVAGLVGVLWVGELLTGIQVLGGVLIVLAMMAAEILPRLWRQPTPTAETAD